MTTPRDPSDARRERRARFDTSRRLALRAIAGAALVLIVGALPALAAAKVNKTRFGGVAIEGYDPVAYFDQGEPIEGSADHSFEWQGATWRFASAEHRDLFTADPEKYAPQYGGFCAYAVSKGSIAGIDPEAWQIVDGRLYLQNSHKVLELWRQDVPGHIAAADENWPKLSE